MPTLSVSFREWIGRDRVARVYTPCSLSSPHHYLLARHADTLILGNWLGNLAWTSQMEWPGHESYAKAPLKDLKLDDETIGSVKSAANLTFTRIHAGGHMVPYDQPEASLSMLNRWLSGEWVET